MKQRLKQDFDPVSIPKSGVSIRTIGNYKYVYHIGKGYRNSKGKPTNDKTCIGKIDNNMLIPNESYFEIYGGKPEIKIEVDTILNYGDYFLLNTIAQEIGLEKVLINVFGYEVGSEILLLAIYMALTGQPLYRCDGWSRETLTGRKGVMTSQRISRILEDIDEHKRMEFFEAWVYARQQKEYLAYDVTSISSYSRGNELVELGYNRDHDALPQVNLGMYYGEESKLPIFYQVYKGSILDKSHLPYMMQYNDRLGIKDVCFVMDRGFYTEDNMKSMSHKHKFIVGVSNSLKISKEMIKEYGQEVMSSRYDIGLTGVSGMQIGDNRYGYRSNMILFYSLAKISDESRNFKMKLQKWEEDLRSSKKIPKEAEEFFTVTKAEKDTVTVTRNHSVIDEYISNLGYFLMVTTDLRKTPEEILEIYRMKDVVEKCFDELKNSIDMKRLRVHSEETMNGKMFVGFIALILRSHLHNKLKNYMETRRVSFAQILDELRMIKTVKVKDGLLQCNPVTKKQRLILECFNRTPEDISQSLQNLSPHVPFDFNE